MTKSAASPVPSYVYYGEDAAEPAFGTFHIERLSLRSALHDWDIAPHAHHGLLQVFVIQQGRARVSLDGRVAEVAAPVILTIPAGLAHALHYEPGAEGHVFTLRDGLLPGLDRAAARLLYEDLFSTARIIDLPDRATAGRLDALLDQLYAEQGQTAAQPPLTGTLLMATVLARICQLRERTRREAPQLPARSRQFRRFEQLVEAHFLERWSPARYAREIGLSESTLDRLCRAFTGSTAFQFISGRLVLEAKRRLAYSTAPVQRIAEELGFKDQAYFSRFMKKQTGHAPVAFRAEARQGAFGG